jgi:general secretion pathway protein K
MVVMGFIIVLVVLAAGFAANMKVEGILARKAGAQSEVEWLCRSGVEISKYILSQQMANTQEPYDSLNQSWAGGPGSTNGLNPLLDNINLTNSAWGDGSVLGLLYPEEDPGEDVRCSIKIVDLERKFNINTAAAGRLGRFPLERAFEMMGVDESLKPYLVDAIIDWYDEDDAEGINGVESKYYEALGYTSKNGYIDDLTELLLIKDITPKMFWGNSTNQLAGTMMTSAVGVEEEEPDYPIGLVDLFTPISGIPIPGNRSKFCININTASSYVLQLLPGMDLNRVQSIMEFREGPDRIDGTWDDEPFTNIQELRNVPGFQSAEALANAGRFLSVRSATFEVTVTAEMRGLRRTLVAVLRRLAPDQAGAQNADKPEGIKILYTFWK